MEKRRGAASTTREDGADDVRDHVTESENEAADDNAHREIPFGDEVIEIKPGRELIESDVTKNDEEDCQNAERAGRDEISGKIIGQVHLHNVLTVVVRLRFASV